MGQQRFGGEGREEVERTGEAEPVKVQGLVLCLWEIQGGLLKFPCQAFPAELTAIICVHQYNPHKR